MLVLSRKKNESIVIGNIVVTIIEVRGDKVRLGIEAPREIEIHRSEVFDAIQGERVEAESESQPEAVGTI